MEVVIDRRFNGPPASAQGGYTCGLVAERVAGHCASVSLRTPPPLERALTFAQGDDGAVALLDGETAVAEGAPAELELDLPDPVSLEEARAARSPWADVHPFPRCFGCGPERSQDEAVAIHSGPVAGRDHIFAGVWVPLEEFTAPRFAWAALDCPTAAPAVPTDAAPSVLANLTARLFAPVRPGEPHVVTAWLLGHDGRKHRGAAAIHGRDGELCGYSVGLWVELRDPSAMGARPR